MSTASFTKAEKRVMAGLLDGLTVKEVAAKNFRSVSTVENQVRSMFEKAEVHALHELISRWYKEHFEITSEELKRRLGAFCLMGLFATFTLAGNPDDLPRRARTRTRSRTEQQVRLAKGQARGI